MVNNNDFALIIPLANEEKEFEPFIKELTKILNGLEFGKVYFVVDNASKDSTREICQQLSLKDFRFITIWAPENKNVVDAYLRGYKEALNNGHDLIIEMDAGLSHDPKAIPVFLKTLNDGFECVFGSRFINGGSISNSSRKRTFLSKTGTILSNLLLGTNMHDMTSGFQGFKASIVKQFINYKLLSTAHFYQTEIRYLLRKKHFKEIPIHYRAPSPSVSFKSIKNSISVFMFYFYARISGNSRIIK